MSINFSASSYILKHVEEVLSGDFGPSIEKMLEMLLGADKIFIYGVGRSGLVGKAFAIRLVQMGLKVFFVGETVTPIVESKDVVVIISNTGETMSAIQTANITRRVGSKVVAITSNPNSKLAHAVNLVVALKPKRDEKRELYAPLGTLFEMCTYAFLDGIVARLMEGLKMRENDLRGRHAIWV